MSNNGNFLRAELWMCFCLFLLVNAGVSSYWFLPLLWSSWLFKVIMALGRMGRNRENWNSSLLSVLTKIIAIFLEQTLQINAHLWLISILLKKFILTIVAVFSLLLYRTGYSKIFNLPIPNMLLPFFFQTPSPIIILWCE